MEAAEARLLLADDLKALADRYAGLELHDHAPLFAWVAGPGASSATGAPEARLAAIGLGQLVDQARLEHRNTGQHELSDPLTVANLKRGVPEIEEDDLELPTIIRVDCTRRVGDDDTVPEREA